MNENYCMIDESTNTCVNVLVWDGDVNKWQPPSGYLVLKQASTPAKDWLLDTALTPPDYVLTEMVGGGQIGFTWDGTYLTTNEPKPEYVPPVVSADQPASNGTQNV